MELNYDWRIFQSVFYPQKRSMKTEDRHGQNHVKTVFVVTDKDRIVTVYADGENFGDYAGAPVAALKSAVGSRELVALDASKVDQWMGGASVLPHWHEQAEFLRKKIEPEMRSKLRSDLREQVGLAEKHFLIDALLGKWGRALPSVFGIFIRLEKAPADHTIPPGLMQALGNRCRDYLDQEQDILVLVRARKLEAFYEPDLSPMGNDRRGECVEVVKYLSEKHGVPVQGISLPYIDWVSWNHVDRPWREVFRAVKSRSVRLQPLRWPVAAWLGARALRR